MHHMETGNSYMIRQCSKEQRLRRCGRLNAPATACNYTVTTVAGPHWSQPPVGVTHVFKCVTKPETLHHTICPFPATPMLFPTSPVIMLSVLPPSLVSDCPACPAERLQEPIPSHASGVAAPKPPLVSFTINECIEEKLNVDKG